MAAAMCLMGDYRLSAPLSEGMPGACYLDLLVSFDYKKSNFMS